MAPILIGFCEGNARDAPYFRVVRDTGVKKGVCPRVALLLSI